VAKARRPVKTFAIVLAEFVSDPNRGRRFGGVAQERLRRAFGRLPINQVTAERIAKFIMAREAEGAFANEINEWEIFPLERCLKWAVEMKYLDRAPDVPESTHWDPRIPRQHDLLLEMIRRQSRPTIAALPASRGHAFSRTATATTAAPKQQRGPKSTIPDEEYRAAYSVHLSNAQIAKKLDKSDRPVNVDKARRKRKALGLPPWKPARNSSPVRI
jgi:hypothetical protein